MIFDQKFMTDLAVFCEDGNGEGLLSITGIVSFS